MKRTLQCGTFAIIKDRTLRSKKGLKRATYFVSNCILRALDEKKLKKLLRLLLSEKGCATIQIERIIKLPGSSGSYDPYNAKGTCGAKMSIS